MWCGGECALSGHGCGSGVSISLVCAYTVPRPHPQAHPVTLLSPTLTAPQAVPKPFQAHSPLATPRGPTLTCTFSARNPSLPKIPPRLRPGSPGSEVILFLRRYPHSQAVGLGPASPQGPRGPASCRVPGPWRCPVAATWSWWGDREFSQLGRAGATGRRAEPRLPPVPARPGWGGGSPGLRCGGTSSEALRWGGGLRVQPRGGRAPG